MKASKARPWSWAVRDGRLEPVGVVNIDRFLDLASGRLKGEALEARHLPPEWLVWEKLFDDAEHGAELRGLELARCRKSLFYFVTTWCWTFDPLDEDSPVKRFPDFDYIKKLCELYQEGKPLFVEKSRQMMASWFFSCAFLWEMLFTSGFSALMMSWRQDRTDDGGNNSTPESLFGKLRWVWLLLPEWMRPRLVFRHRKIQHAQHKDRWITGETASSRSGRGGTYRRAFLDELAHYEHSSATYHAVKSACPRGMICASTPNGKGNHFWYLKAADTTSFIRFRLHWTAHPDRRVGLYKDETGRLRSPWYDEQARDMTEAYVAQELDISYEKSKEGAVYYSFQLEHIDERTPKQGGMVPGSAELTTIVGWDFGQRAGNAVAWVQSDGDSFELFDYYGGTNRSALFMCEYIAWMRGDVLDERGRCWIPAEHAQRLERAFGCEPGIYAHLNPEHVGDPAGRGIESDHKSWMQRLSEGSDRFEWVGSDGRREPRIVGAVDVVPVKRVKVSGRIQLVQWLLERGKLRVRRTKTTEPLITAFTEYAYPTDEEGEITSSKPNHDKFSHPMDAVGYVAVHLFWGTGRYPMSGDRAA